MRYKHFSLAPVPIGADRVDLKGLIKHMAASIPSHKIAQRLSLHSNTLVDDEAEWLMSTLTRLHHLLHIFFLMMPAKNSAQLDPQVSCTCSFRTEAGQVPTKPTWDGVLPTHAMAEANHDCSMLFLNAFLASEGATLLLWLVAELLEAQTQMTARQTPEVARVIQHRVGKSLECILKIFWVIQRACGLAGVKLKFDKILIGECETMKAAKFRISAAMWVEKEKPLWWTEAGVDEAIRTMLPWQVPEAVSLALMELLIDVVLVPPLQDDFNPPTFHIKYFKQLSLLPLITTALLASSFTGLENCLRYFAFLVLQKSDNTRLLMEESKNITFIMPVILTAGTTAASSRALRDRQPEEAEEKAAGVLRLAVSFLVAVFQLYFQNMDTRDSEEHGPRDRKSVV